MSGLKNDQTGKCHPDCVTETRKGNTVLVVSGYFKKDGTLTAADRMARVLEEEQTAISPE